MNDIISRILEGKFEPETGSLDFSCTTVEIQLKPGQNYEGTFTIYGPADKLTQGFISATGLGMKCCTTEFAGSVSEIAFCFDTLKMQEGDVRQGEFIIISNHGEYQLPYKVTALPEEIPSSLGIIKNLFHFTNLAKANWEEALKLFYSEAFAKVFTGADKQHYQTYRGFCGIYGNEWNMEEFLIAIKKKQRIEYLATEEEIRIEEPMPLKAPKASDDSSDHSAGYLLTISRNGWGYTELHIETDGVFLHTDKETVREEDFLGNIYQLPYYIVEGKLHHGRNFGMIRLYNAHFECRIPVTVSKNLRSAKAAGRVREQKHLTLQLMEYYTAFRSKKISAATWMKETGKLVDNMIAFNEKDIAAKLFRAQLMITEERFQEADWLLRRVYTLLQEKEEWDPALWCYYQYLTTLQSGEEEYIDEIAAQVERVFTQNSENWRIAWLVIYLLEDYNKSPSKKWIILEEQFTFNCTSPVIYIEAYHLLTQNPTLLMKLESFEIQVLLYAARKELLSGDIIGQVVYLVSKCKSFSRPLYSILQACFKASPTDEVLKAICGLLIKGNKTGIEFFDWYHKGIERKLRVTRLYEYYMMSVDLESEEMLPKIVLMYFAFNSDLDYVRNSYLYANIYKYRESLSEIYDSYQLQIERFVVNQITRGRINKWLAYLYKEFVSPGMITEETAAGLARALFSVQITVHRENIRQIVVIYEKGKKEITFPVSGQQAYIPLYGQGFAVFLEDKYNNRYADENGYTIDTLIWPDKLAKMIVPLVQDQIGFDLWLCETGREIAPITEENLAAMRRVLDADWLLEEYQKEMMIKLIRYYHENGMSGFLDGCLCRLTAGQVESRCYVEILRLMVTHYLYEKAYEWVAEIGDMNIDAKDLVRLLGGLLGEDAKREELQADKIICTLAYMAFQAGKYDDKVLGYLTRYFQATTRQMRDIWKAAKAFSMDTYELCEKILIQMLLADSFVGERMEIFRDYVAGGAKGGVETAFLAQCAYDYFVKEKVTSLFAVQQMERVFERNEELSQVCKLAFVKYFAENRNEIDDSVMPLLKHFLLELTGNNIYLAFFKEYAGLFPFMEQFADKTIIEYRMKPGNRAIIHYLIEREEESEAEYIKEEMRDMYGGVCAKQFLLFFGEQLLYYIAEEEDGRESLTESACVSKGVSPGELPVDQRDCKYNLINDIMIAKTLKDYATVESLLQEYYQQEFVVSQLFSLR